MDKKIIGEKISSLRKEKGRTQKELADRLGVTDKAISKWETGVYLQGLQGGVYGITTNLLMILAMTAFVSGIETLINLRKL